MKKTASMVLVAFALVLTGCSGPYKITEPSSGTTYYTKSYDQKRDGPVTFRDEKTDSKVTLQSAQIKEISKKEYKEAVKN